MERRYVTVSAINRYLKAKITSDKQLSHLYVKGEISNFKHHSSGHLYFSLKDETSRINAIMFSSNASKLNFKLEDGMQVIVTASVSIYEANGSYQLYVSDIQIDGIGNLYLAFLQLKEKLSQEGLFDINHKKKLPLYPENIGIITSQKGAAIQDILRTIKQRYPIANILIYPTLVQGNEAYKEIIQALKTMDHQKMNVIILARGGGSIEDLWAFNHEEVARTIYACQTPIVTGIGHETDMTIADFVSDYSAPTPTGAALAATNDLKKMAQDLMNQKNRLNRSMIHKIEQDKQRLQQLRSHYTLNNFDRFIKERELYLSFLSDQLYTKMNLKVHSNKQNALKVIYDFKQKAQRFIVEEESKVDSYQQRLLSSYQRYLQNKNEQLSIHLIKMDAYSPLHILKRGYTLVYQDHTLIKNASQLNKDDIIKIRFYDKEVEAKIK